MVNSVRRSLLLLVFCLVFVQACAGTQARDDQGLMMRTELIFGLSTPDGAVSGAEFRKFVDEYITPRFRDGLTVIRAEGQWQNQDGQVEKERSIIVMIVHDETAQADQDLDFIREKYKALYKQEAVLRLDWRTAVDF